MVEGKGVGDFHGGSVVKNLSEAGIEPTPPALMGGF